MDHKFFTRFLRDINPCRFLQVENHEYLSNWAPSYMCGLQIVMGQSLGVLEYEVGDHCWVCLSFKFICPGIQNEDVFNTNRLWVYEDFFLFLLRSKFLTHSRTFIPSSNHLSINMV